MEQTNQGKELAKVTAPQSLATVTHMEAELFEMFRSVVCPSGKPEHAVAYLARCNAKGLDAWTKPFHFWIDNKGPQMPMEVHAMIGIAARTGTFRLGTANSKGIREACTFDETDGKIQSCTAYGELKDDNGDWHPIMWTVYRSDLEHLFKKDNWQQGRHMFQVRAIANLLRMFCADLLGDCYDPSEIVDTLPRGVAESVQVTTTNPIAALNEAAKAEKESAIPAKICPVEPRAATPDRDVIAEPTQPMEPVKATVKAEQVIAVSRVEKQEELDV